MPLALAPLVNLVANILRVFAILEMAENPGIAASTRPIARPMTSVTSDDDNDLVDARSVRKLALETKARLLARDARS